MSQLGPSFKMGFLLFVLIFGLSAAGLYGGSQLVDDESTASADDGGAGGVPGGPVTVTVIGKNSTFGPRSINASPGVPVTVTFDNQDAGVPHNIHFYATTSKSSTLKMGEIIQGPLSETITFNAPAAPGNYPFVCDVHADTMTGILAVK